MLWGWVDTIKDNYPCVPPYMDSCFTWNHVVVAFPQLEKHMDEISEFYRQSLGQRLGKDELTLDEAMFEASKIQMAPEVLPTIVENDSWVYKIKKNNQTTTGPSLVCSSLICSIWRAGGMFADINGEINCTEFMTWDVLSLQIFDSNFQRPKECVEADPDSNLCQLLGDYTLPIKDFNSKAPFKHMNEKCPNNNRLTLC